jgi:hypothetical protein
LPFYQDSIVAKVLRVADAPTLKRKSMLRRKNVEQLAASSVSSGAAMFGQYDTQDKTDNRDSRPPRAAPRPQPVYSDEPAPANSAPVASTSARRPAPAAPSPKPTAISSSAPAPARDILDFESSTPGGGSSSNKSTGAVPASATPADVDDILDFGSGPSTSSATPAAAQPKGNISDANLAAMMDLDGAPTLSRSELKATKEAKINEQVQKAAEEKQEVWCGDVIPLLYLLWCDNNFSMFIRSGTAERIKSRRTSTQRGFNTTRSCWYVL